MSRNTVTITDTSLSVEPHGLDKMWSYTSRLEFPLAHVRGATHDPGLRHEPKGWRGPGLQAGSKLSGTFHADGTAQFWNISGYENTLVVTLEDERFTHLYLTVDDPAGLAAQINAAIRPAQVCAPACAAASPRLRLRPTHPHPQHSPAGGWGGAPLRALTPERAAHGTTTRARQLAPRGRAPTAPSAREVPHAPTTLTHEGVGQLRSTDSTRLLQPHLL